MSIPKKLKSLRTGTRGCRMTAYVDLSSGMVLRASAKSEMKQETLDAHAAAARALVGQGGPDVASALIGPVEEAVILGPETATMYLASQRDPTDGLAIEARPRTDLVALLAAALDALETHEVQA